MKKGLLACIAVLILMLCAGTATAEDGQWSFYGQHLVYVQNNERAVGKQTIDGITYTFTEDGYLMGNGKVQRANDALYYIDKENNVQTGWQTVDGSKYYFYSYYGAAVGFARIDDGTYYFDADGKMQTGWVTDNDYKYYFGKDGKQLTGWQTIGTDKYYLNNAVVTGSYSIYNTETQQYDYYYFDKDGKMQTGWVTVENNRYYYGKDGKQLTGWQTIGKDQYYLNPYVYTGECWIENGDTEQYDAYYFDKDGKMQTGWVTIEEKKYYYGKDGKKLTGWQTIDGDTYYLYDYAYTGSVSLYDSETEKYDSYYFDEDGKMQTGWIVIEEKKKYFGKDGKEHYGWLKVDNDTYYLDYSGTVTGLTYIHDETDDQIINLYCFDEDGKMQTGLVTAEENLYYFGEDGIAETGWKLIDSAYYYFSEYGKAAMKGLRTVDGKYYFFDENGVMQTGWNYVDSYQYWRLFNDDGSMVKSFSGLTSIEIPEKVDQLSTSLFAGIGRDFVIYCKPGSYAEKFARSYGFQYDTGEKRVVGYQITDLNTKVNWIVENYTDSSMSSLEKVRALHNWLIFNAHYDTSYRAHSASGVLLNGSGVCESYARALQLLLNAVGIENLYISGSADNGSGSGPEGHAWNMVKLGENWYHIDATWDDPVSSMSKDDPIVSGGEWYDLFLVSDAEIGRDHFWSARVTAAEGIEWYGEPGWKAAGTGWVYYDEYGALVTEPTEIDGKFYGFGDDGRLLTGGWYGAGSRYYYANTDGTLLRDQWLSEGGQWYYFMHNGRMATGWQEIKEIYYFFQSDGAMATGWLNDNGTFYYLNTDGSLVTGWLGDGGEWYYLDSKTGAMKTGWIQVKEDWYLLDGSGVMLTGWQKSGGNWYFFRDSGKMVTGWYEEPANASHPDRSWWYWFDKDGRMGTGWQEIDGQWEMFDDSGVWLYTWDGN